MSNSKNMDFQNLKDLFVKFSNDEVCREYLETMRWNGTITCPYCQHSGKIYRIENGKRYKCGNKECHKKFSVTVGTIFENTKIDLRTWFGALYLCTAHKKGISSLQLHRDLGVTQKTAWFMLQRIREMLKNDAPDMLKNTVEIDETYVGGKEKNKHASKKSTTHFKSGRNVDDKTPVLGIVERGGDVYAKKMYTAQQHFVMPVITAKVHPEATVMTDDWAGYTKLTSRYNHFVINHSAGKYVNGNIHTNTIEGFWSLLKRGIVGIYHSVSYKHLDFYCSEFAYRYNTRKVTDAQRFHLTVPRAEGKRLKYKEVTSQFYGLL